MERMNTETLMTRSATLVMRLCLDVLHVVSM